MSLDHNEVAVVKSSRNRTRTCPARGLQGQDNTKHSVSSLQLGKVKVKRAVWCSSAVVATTDSSWAQYTLRCKTMHHLLEGRSGIIHVLPGICLDFVRDHQDVIRDLPGLVGVLPGLRQGSTTIPSDVYKEFPYSCLPMPQPLILLPEYKGSIQKYLVWRLGVIQDRHGWCI